jgi:uncharacterized membrane protein
VFRFVSCNKKNSGLFWLVLVCFFRFVSVFHRNNQNKQKFSLKYQNLLSIKMFQLVFCLFRFSQNKQTHCFTTEAKQQKQTVSKQTENNPKFSEKYLYMLSIKLFWLVFYLFRFNLNTETRCFSKKRNNRNKRFVSDSPKTIVLVPVSVVSSRN